MCMYCTFREDGWTALLDYDDRAAGDSPGM
jgi:hypothetical protein